MTYIREYYLSKSLSEFLLNNFSNPSYQLSQISLLSASISKYLSSSDVNLLQMIDIANSGLAVLDGYVRK